MAHAREIALSADTIKRLVRERDNMRCTECGMTNEQHRRRYGGKSLDVHRVVPGSAYTLEGCVTLCRLCHGAKLKSPPGATGTSKKPMSYRLTDRAAEIIRGVADKLGLSATAVVEVALRRLGEAELPADAPPPGPGTRRRKGGAG